MDGALSASAAELAEKIWQREISARELVTAHLERLDETARLNAVVTRCDDRALEEADAADRALTSGAPTGPLHGLPFAVKDAFDTAGIRTTAASPGLADHVPTKDATVVRRLREAGAILVGKSNTAELTLRYETDNELFGQTWNPHDPALSPGGSSGGSAAAVASGGVTFDVGTDTGGSVRLPAHFCGVVGLKPTGGRVPRTGLTPTGIPIDPLTQPGPLTRTVDDAELILHVIAGPDDRDPDCLPLSSRGDRPAVAGLRVGVVTGDGDASPTPAVAEAIADATAALTDQGARIEPVEPAPMRDAGRLFVGFFTADGGAWLRDLVAGLGAPDSSVAPPSPVTAPPVSAWTEQLGGWQRFRHGMMTLLAGRDALVLPVHPEAARAPRELERPDRLRGYRYVVAFNLTGWPAISVPAGSTEDGLPVGVQVVARAGREDLVLAVARAIEDAAEGRVPSARPST